MAAAIEEGIARPAARPNKAYAYAQVEEIRRLLFVLIDHQLAAACPAGPAAVDALQRAANELGVFEAELSYSDWS